MLSRRQLFTGVAATLAISPSHASNNTRYRILNQLNDLNAITAEDPILRGAGKIAREDIKPNAPLPPISAMILVLDEARKTDAKGVAIANFIEIQRLLDIPRTERQREDQVAQFAAIFLSALSFKINQLVESPPPPDKKPLALALSLRIALLSAQNTSCKATGAKLDDIDTLGTKAHDIADRVEKNVIPLMTCLGLSLKQ